MTKKNASNLNPAPTGNVPKLSEGQLEPLFRRLNLANTPRIYQQVADRAEKENWSYRDFLAILLAEEVAHRKQTRLQRCTRNAHFPFFKTIDEFDFSLQTTLRQSLLGSYLGIKKSDKLRVRSQKLPMTETGACGLSAAYQALAKVHRATTTHRDIRTPKRASRDLESGPLPERDISPQIEDVRDHRNWRKAIPDVSVLT